MDQGDVRRFWRRVETRKQLKDVADDDLFDVMLNAADQDPPCDPDEFDIICDEFQKRGKSPVVE